MLKRVMPELMGMKNILVLNDEAHHCYRERPGEGQEGELKGDEKKDAEKNREAARLWISGIEAVSRKLGASRVIDLSATPFFLSGSGYAEGTLFPWTMCDFSLMDAIECGIVKLPRVPVADNVPNNARARAASGASQARAASGTGRGRTASGTRQAREASGTEMPMYRELWKHIRTRMPRQGRGKAGALDPSSLPPELRTALDALYGHYEETFGLWREAGISVPPCFIWSSRSWGIGEKTPRTGRRRWRPCGSRCAVRVREIRPEDDFTDRDPGGTGRCRIVIHAVSALW